MGPCGRGRQVLFDYYPSIRVMLPTPDGVRSVTLADLIPLATAWSFEDGSTPAQGSEGAAGPGDPPAGAGRSPGSRIDPDAGGVWS